LYILGFISVFLFARGATMSILVKSFITFVTHIYFDLVGTLVIIGVKAMLTSVLSAIRLYFVVVNRS